MSIEVYVRDREAGEGPFAFEDVSEAVSLGALQQGQLGWCRGLHTWVPISDVLRFVESIQSSDQPESIAFDQFTYR